MARLVVGIFAIGKDRMRELSHVYARKDEAPYVLTFNYDQSLSDNKILLGDILIRSPSEYSDEEVARWLEHGFKNLWSDSEVLK
jgi:ssRNA-specific RNase YbeY (16S rRNA maturation enzyme)